MKPVTSRMNKSRTNDEIQVRSLFQQLLECWNNRSASEYAALFAEDGNLVGFDGSQINGRAEIESHLRGIFGNHQTAVLVQKVREIRFLASDVSILRAVAGVVPPGQSDLNPALNMVLMLVVAKQTGQWRIAVFQSTPAAFHGRPEASAQLTEELRQVLR